MLGCEGTIMSWTIIRVPPCGFSNLAPYPVVIVSLSGGKRMTAQLVDLPAGEAGWTENLVGMKVRVVIRRMSEPSIDGIIPYGVKVKPI